jgi:hypothetical protein
MQERALTSEYLVQESAYRLGHGHNQNNEDHKLDQIDEWHLGGSLQTFWVDERPEQIEKDPYRNETDDDVLGAHRPDTILSAK